MSFEERVLDKLDKLQDEISDLKVSQASQLSSIKALERSWAFKPKIIGAWFSGFALILGAMGTIIMKLKG